MDNTKDSSNPETIKKSDQSPHLPDQPELQAWKTFDGEGGYEYMSYEYNEDYRERYARYNPSKPHWIEPLILLSDYTDMTTALHARIATLEQRIRELNG